MHPSCNINTSTNLNDPSRALDDYYYYNYFSPSLFPSSPSFYHQYYIHDSDNNNNNNNDNNIEADFLQDFLENHQEIIQPQQQYTHLENNNNINDTNNKNSNNKENFQQNKSKRVCYDKISSPRKRISKKDKHTKIETAQGPRDRRMRLSLNVARKFFDLQDMLGFDKASKTVEWLLTKSISSISELSRSFQRQVGGISSSVSSTSEILMDELLLSSTHGNLNNKEIANNNKNNSESKKANKKVRVVRTIHPLARKLREEARKRARERTKEKMSNLKKRRELSGVPNVGYGSSLGSAGCWSPSSTYLDLQQNGGIIHGHYCFSDIEDLSGNLGEATLW